MNVFGERSPWDRSPFAQRRTLGQKSSDGEMILANGGWVQKRDGVLWFLLASDTMDLIEKATGERPPEAAEARIRFCNKTPGTAPVLGDFEDPETGLWCFLELQRKWNDAWRGYI